LDFGGDQDGLLVKPMKRVDKLLHKAYNRYCNGDDHCFILTCPVNVLMFNIAIHNHERNELLMYGDYKILERLGK